MSVIKQALSIALLSSSRIAFAEGIPGCTFDVRTGVCNKICSVSHVAGCTLNQLKPLLLIQNMDCLTVASTNGTDKTVCSKQFDKALEEWKNAHKKQVVKQPAK